jgi:Uma2 family endonuclease
MSVAVPIVDAPPQAKRFTVEDFYRMAAAGVLGSEHQRIELIEGIPLELMPIGPSHAGHVLRLVNLLNLKLKGAYLVSSQNPVRLNEFSEPLPDVAVLRPRDDFYTGAHPGPADVLMLVEVADTSLDYDLNRKGRLYAQASIPEYWVLDLAAQRLRVLRAPEGDEFRETMIIRRGEKVQCRTIAELTVTVDEILG